MDDMKEEENPLQVSISGHFDKTLGINKDEKEDSDMFADNSTENSTVKKNDEAAKFLAHKMLEKEKTKVRMISISGKRLCRLCA